MTDDVTFWSKVESTCQVYLILLILLHRRMIFKMLALKRLAEKWPCVPVTTPTPLEGGNSFGTPCIYRPSLPLATKSWLRPPKHECIMYVPCVMPWNLRTRQRCCRSHMWIPWDICTHGRYTHTWIPWDICTHRRYTHTWIPRDIYTHTRYIHTWIPRDTYTHMRYIQ